MAIGATGGHKRPDWLKKMPGYYCGSGLGRVAERLERSRSTSHDPEDETPKGGLKVILDGDHIRCRREYQQRDLVLVVGKIESRNTCRRFGLVVSATASPSNRMRDEMSAFGWKRGHLLTVISDGELAFPILVLNSAGGDDHVKHSLDWLHISMRIYHVEGPVQRFVQTPGSTGNLELFQRPAESLRWRLWHGRARVAETCLKGPMVDCAQFAIELLAVRAAAARLRARCATLYTFLANKMQSYVDYGCRYRIGMPISYSRAEGSVDDIANSRMGSAGECGDFKKDSTLCRP